MGLRFRTLAPTDRKRTERAEPCDRELRVAGLRKVTGALVRDRTAAAVDPDVVVENEVRIGDTSSGRELGCGPRELFGAQPGREGDRDPGGHLAAHLSAAAHERRAGELTHDGDGVSHGGNEIRVEDPERRVVS